jgi:hypothetical protein
MEMKLKLKIYAEKKIYTLVSLLVFIFAIGSWLFSIIKKAPTLWFYVDEWWVVRRISSNSMDYLVPFNEHLTLIPLFIYKNISRFFTMESYVPYFTAMLVPLLLTCLSFALVLKKKFNTPLWVILLMSTLFLINGPGSSSLVWAFQMGVTIQTLLFSLIFAIRFTDFKNYYIVRYMKPIVLAGLLVISVFTSGAFPFILLAYFILNYKEVKGYILILIATPSTLLFILWYLSTGLNYPGPGVGLINHPEVIWQFPKFFIGMLFFSVNTFSPSTYLNVLFILILVVTAIVGDKDVRRVVIACLSVELIFSFVTTLTRLSLGFPLTGSGHYQYIQSAFLFLPASIAIGKIIEFCSLKYPATKYLATLICLTLLATIYLSKIKYDSMINWRSQVDQSIKTDFKQACEGLIDTSKIGESAKVYGFNMWPGQIDENLISELRDGRLFPISCKSN